MSELFSASGSRRGVWPVLLAVLGAVVVGEARAQPQTEAQRPTLAAEPELNKEEIVKLVRDALGNKRIRAADIRRSQLPGYWEYAPSDPTQGALLVSLSGRHLVLGRAYERRGGVVSELTASTLRQTLLFELGNSDYIAFSVADAPTPPSQAIYVFTDVTCPHCRRMHGKIDSYTGLGVEVRYLPLPRHGKGSEGWKQTGRAWCAEDRQAALTDLKKGRTAGRPCRTDQLLDRYSELAKKLGVRATPTIVLQDGRKIEGHVSAEALAQLLPRRRNSR